MDRIEAGDEAPGADGIEDGSGLPGEARRPAAIDPWPDGHDEYLKLSRHLRCLAVTLVSDEASADDVVQEAWLAALDGPPERVLNLNAWLSQVVRNLAKRRHVRAARRREVETLWAPAEEDESVEPESAEVERESGYRLLRTAVEELEEPYRTIVRERFFEERTLAEIARRTSRPLNTIKSQVHRGVAKLRDILDRRSHGDRAAWSLALLTGLSDRFAESEGEAGAGMESAVARASAWKLALLPSIVLVPVALFFAWRLLLAVPSTETSLAPRTAELADAGSSRSETVEPRTGVDARRSVDAELDAPRREAPENPVDSAPLPAADLRRIELVLTDEAGQPVAEARAHVWGRMGKFLGAHPSDANGRVVLDVPLADLDETSRFPTDPGVSVTARRPGAAWSFTYHLPVPEAGARLALELPDSGQDVEGVVRDAYGAPVEGARVSVRGNARFADITPEGVPFGERLLATRSDAEGRFRIEGLPVRAHEVFVRATGLLPGRVALDEPGDRLAVEVTLEEGAVLRGSLVLPDGSPAAGARVFDGRMGMRGEVGGPPETTTDDDGRFELIGLMPGEQRIFATLEDGRAGSASTLLSLALDEPATWNATLADQPALVVRVLDEEDVPFANAGVVVALATGPPWAKKGQTGDDGTAEFRALPEGPLAVLIQRDIRDVAPARVVRGVRPGPDAVQVRLPALEPRPGRLQGTLEEADGTPLARAIVVGCGEKQSFRADADAQGGFSVGSLEPGAYEAWAVLEGLGILALGELVVLEDELFDLGTRRPTEPTGAVRVEWGARQPNEKGPFVLSAHPRCGATEGFPVEILHEPRETFELLPGRYLLRPADRSVEGFPFVVESGGTQRVLAE